MTCCRAKVYILHNLNNSNLEIYKERYITGVLRTLNEPHTQRVRTRGIKNICLYFSTQKLCAIYVFNCVQSNSTRFLCMSVHFNVGRDVTIFLDETFPGRWVGRGGPTA